MGIIAPLKRIGQVLNVFTEFNEMLRVLLKKAKSEGGAEIQFLGGTVRFADSNPNEKLVALVPETAPAGSASIARAPPLAGKPCFARTAATGRFGRVALKRFY